ncbi:MAG: TIGR03986 family type III CRISPR-associated RAMP protein [Blastocatellia bacterium]
MKNRKIVNLPAHQNPARDRTACAPYNFVPLPEMVVVAACECQELPRHDRFYPETGDQRRRTGYFDVTLTTKSPLYVRGMLSHRRPDPETPSEFERAEAEKAGKSKQSSQNFRAALKNKPDFFFTHDPEQPVIPGSSLRGMLRALVEIISYGKVQWVTEKQLFFRTVDNTAVGTHYRNRMVGANQQVDKVETGFLRRDGNRYVIKTCSMARVHRDRLPNRLYDRVGQTFVPSWALQHRPVWVQLSDNRRFVTDISDKKVDGYQEGRLVISGDIPRKKKEFVFLLPAESAEEITVLEELINRFHDDDQITQWQERAFPKNRPERKDSGAKKTDELRERNGMLLKEPGLFEEPIFFVREEGLLSFIGRARMFRLPYKKSPRDLVPPELRNPAEIDYAEALFGYVRTSEEIKQMQRGSAEKQAPRQGEPERAYAGRVFVTDATYRAAPNGLWLSATPIAPRILATPKPTAFQQYLVQPSEQNYDYAQLKKRALSHYDSPTKPDDGPPSEASVIRGHKLYWHQGERALDDIREQVDPPGSSTQHTQFKPINAEVTFSFRAYFENLSDQELGALCWALHPLGDDEVRRDATRGYCHKLGMGKPFGMGAVKLNATLHLTDRTERYQTLFDGPRWATGTRTGEQLAERTPLVKAATDAFESAVLDALKPFKQGQQAARLADLKRVAMLLKIMEWPGFRPQYARPAEGELGGPNTRYMTIQPNEYRDRPVLPDAAAFGKLTGEVVPEVHPEASPGTAKMTETEQLTTATTQPDKAARRQRTITFEDFVRTQEEKKTKPAQAFSGEKRMLVTLLTTVADGRARVQVEDSEQPVACKNFGYAPAVEAGTKCWVNVQYDKGVPVSAVFLKWQ